VFGCVSDIRLPREINPISTAISNFLGGYKKPVHKLTGHHRQRAIFNTPADHISTLNCISFYFCPGNHRLQRVSRTMSHRRVKREDGPDNIQRTKMRKT
jgi:hypothetical protein